MGDNNGLTDAELLVMLAEAQRVEHLRLSGHDAMYGGYGGCDTCRALYTVMVALEKRANS